VEDNRQYYFSCVQLDYKFTISYTNRQKCLHPYIPTSLHICIQVNIFVLKKKTFRKHVYIDVNI
jgi:hypothetical protein